MSAGSWAGFSCRMARRCSAWFTPLVAAADDDGALVALRALAPLHPRLRLGVRRGLGVGRGGRGGGKGEGRPGEDSLVARHGTVSVFNG